MKRIVILCDGTWNDTDQRWATNVLKIKQGTDSAGKRRDEHGKWKPIHQQFFYDTGVGSDSSGLQRLVEGAIGTDLDEKVFSAYLNLCSSYEPGDEVCIYGFSRGAYTARTLAGMVCRVGIVKMRHAKQLKEAIKVYRSKKGDQHRSFKANYCHQNTTVALLGCWDTVGALGIPNFSNKLKIDAWVMKNYAWGDTVLSNQIERAFHAVSMDERRKPFIPTLMTKPKGKNSLTTFKQHYFAGDHTGVGGGMWEKRGISNRTLQWMIDCSKESGIDLCFEDTQLNEPLWEDETVYCEGSGGLFFPEASRRAQIGKSIKWDAIDDSLKDRWVTLPHTCENWIKKKFEKELKKHKPAHPKLCRTKAEQGALAKGKKTWCQVFSRKHKNNTFVSVKKGDTFQFSVSKLQAWKDGGFDPCDVLGWNISTKGPEGNNAWPWMKGELAEINQIKSGFINRFKSKREVVDANWFSLIASSDGENFSAVKQLPLEENETTFMFQWEAKKDGNLFLTANDLDVFLADKYKNNEGWIMVEISKL